MEIDIHYDPAAVAASARRMEAMFSLGMADRPPVIWGACPRMLLARRGSSFKRFFFDPITQATELLLNHQWLAENVPGDTVSGLTVGIQPQFENVSNSQSLGAGVRWDEDQPPQVLPCIQSLSDLEAYEPPPLEGTLWRRMMEWHREIQAWLDGGGVKVTLGGEPVRVDLGLHIGGESPFCVAVDLCGSSAYEWLVEAPEAMHRLLGLITDRLIEVEQMMRRQAGEPERGTWFLTDDSAQIVSLRAYREFAVPYSRRMYEAFAGPGDKRVMHLCGRHAHLYPALLEDLQISGIWGFGAPVTPEEARDAAGGRIWFVGNLDCSLLCDGPADRIVAEIRRLLDALGPCGGLGVGDGYNLIPDTPLDHLRLVVDTVTQWAEAFTRR
jgi:hypothetical protein